MRRTAEILSWVVYQMTLKNKQGAVNVVCAQSEWDALELSQPGSLTLVRSGIGSEAEAEILARGTSGDPRKRKS